LKNGHKKTAGGAGGLGEILDVFSGYAEISLPPGSAGEPKVSKKVKTDRIHGWQCITAG
jgi:hypothetical protein